MTATWTDLGIDLRSGATGNVKAICPQCSHRRTNHRDRSLSVNVDTGVYKCHYCGWKGSLHLGEPDLAMGRHIRPKIYRKPEPLPETDLSPKAIAFFRDRGISLDVVRRRRITDSENTIHFPYFREGELVNVKHRRAGKKFFMEQDCELTFYGLDDCATSSTVVIVEGEMDALAVETAGIENVLSVPNGGQVGRMDYLASAEDIFARCHTVILAGDNDTVGLQLEAELARRLGKEKCYRVRWPEGCKDANDTLLAHGADMLCRLIVDAEPFPIEGIHTTDDVKENLMTLYRLGRPRGASTGWPSVDHLYTVKPGQLTIVTGIPGSGKSEWLDALILNLCKTQGWPFGIFSPENYPTELHLAKLAEKYVQKPFGDGPNLRMSMQEALDFNVWAKDKLYFIVPPEPTLEDVLSLADALVFRHGIQGLIIDPWNEIDHSRPRELTETEHVSRCLTRLRQFARDHEIHIWVVAHPRIMRRDKDDNIPTPTPYDISGSAHWFNKADNCLTVWRNKDDAADPVQIHVQKIRFREIGQLGTAYLNYDRLTGNYRDIGRWDAAGAK